MKVKSVDIARRLGLSKATVSLALNGKPGVNERTRQRVFECQGLLEKELEEALQNQNKTILAIVLNHNKHVLYDPKMDLFSDVVEGMEETCHLGGYQFRLEYRNDVEQKEADLLALCQEDRVKGVIFLGAEYLEIDRTFCSKIQKPKIIYDYDLSREGISSVYIDNENAAMLACSYLWDRGHRSIRYLSTSTKDVFNFDQRRKAFLMFLIEHGRPAAKTAILPMGIDSAEMIRRIRTYLQQEWNHEALVLENYQISTATLLAARSLSLSVPEDLPLVGIDRIGEVPGSASLPQVGIYHKERGALAIDLLIREISLGIPLCSRILVMPYLIPPK